MTKQLITINPKRLQQTINKYAEYGLTKNNGVTRLALSEQDIQVRKQFKSDCEALGMKVIWDDLGNIYARLDGKNNEKPPIVIGSHLDSVEKGGRFDGVLGVLTGLEIVRTIVDNNITPKIPIVVANITNEEGARFEPAMMSSGILAGRFDKDTMFQTKDIDGVTFGEALTKSGYEGLKENRLVNTTAFLELHIEQGPVLETEDKQIGVVEGVVGMVNYEIKVTGDSNHAGTTPMGLRKDALFTTSDIIQEIQNKMDKLDNELVYTIGRLDVEPNIHTVIPNEVIFTIEARHKNPNTITEVENLIQSLPTFMEDKPCNIELNKQWDRSTVWFDEKVVELIESSAKEAGYSYKRMVSGAGHDAQFIATYTPAAMIFVPSVNGKSHSEDEFTHLEDCRNGVNVMLQTVLKMIE